MVYLTSFTVFSGDIKKREKSSENEKKNNKINPSENDQLVNWSFSGLFFFRPPPHPKSEKNSVNQLIKKFWPYSNIHFFSEVSLL